MPTYEYACRECGHHFEARQSFSETPLTSCPVCQGELRRVFHPVTSIPQNTTRPLATGSNP